MTSSRRFAGGATAVLLALWVLHHFAQGKPLWTFVRVLGELLFILVTLWLPGFSILTRFFGKSLQKDELHLLAVPATLALSLVMFVLLYAVSAPVLLYRVCYLGMFAWMSVWLLRSVRQGVKLAVPRSLVLVGLLALFATSFICTGLQDSPWKAMDGAIPANRATHALPGDNTLQWDTAQVFIAGSEPWAWNDGYWNWSMGDRPPLLGAVTTIYAKSYLSYRRPRYFDYTLIAICLNALYLLPLVHLARRLGSSERTALLATLSLALTPYFVLNTYYTWPKLAGLFLTLTALAFFVRRSPDDPWTWTRPRGALTLGILLSLAANSHSGTILSMPLLMAVIALSGRDWAPRRLFTGASLALLAFAAGALPWFLYKARHPAIQTNNLIYHYRAVKDRPGDPLPFSTWIEQVPIQKQLEIRWGHVVEVLSTSEFRATFDAYVSGTLDAFYAVRWPKEFYHPLSQVDEVRWTLGGVATLILCSAWFLAKRTHYASWPVTRLGRIQTGTVLTLLAVAMFNYLLNILLKWTEIVPHALPMAEIACIILALTLLAYGASRWLGHAVLGVVLVRFFHFSLAATLSPALFGIFGIGFLMSGAMMIWLAFSTRQEPTPLLATQTSASLA